MIRNTSSYSTESLLVSSLSGLLTGFKASSQKETKDETTSDSLALLLIVYIRFKIEEIRLEKEYSDAFHISLLKHQNNT